VATVGARVNIRVYSKDLVLGVEREVVTFEVLLAMEDGKKNSD
jgi:hypothetical protein